MQGEHDDYVQKCGDMLYAVEGLTLLHKGELRQGDAFQFNVRKTESKLGKVGWASAGERKLPLR